MLAIYIHIIGALALLISTGGLRINSHYCENEFVKNSLNFSLRSCCTKDEPYEWLLGRSIIYDSNLFDQQAKVDIA